MLGRHLLGYLPVNLAQVIVGFGGVWALTRILETGEYGYYAVIMAAMAFIHVPLFSWLDAASSRFNARARARGETAAHFATLLALYGMIAAPAALLLAGLTFCLPLTGDMRAAFGFMAGSILFRGVVKLVLEAHRAEHQVGRYCLTETLHLLGGFGLGVALILFTPLRASGPFAGMLVAALCVVLAEGPRLARRAAGGRAEPARIRRYAMYGLPIALTLILHHAVAMSDRFLILWLIGDEAAGVYAAGYALADRTLDVLFIWIGLAALPLAVTALEHEGQDQARAAARRNALLMALIGAPAAAGLALVAGPLAAVMTGEEFRLQAARIIPWIAFAALLNGFMVYYFDEAFALSGRTGMNAVVMVVPAVLNIVLNLILLPRMGVMGAVAATVAAYAAGAVLSALVGRRYFNLPVPWGEFGKIGVACAVMAMTVWILPDMDAALATLGLKASAGAAVYLLCAWLIDAGECRSFLSEVTPRRRVRQEAQV